MNGADIPIGSDNLFTPYWLNIQTVDETGQRYLVTTTSDFTVSQRWVFEIDMELRTATLLE